MLVSTRSHACLDTFPRSSRHVPMLVSTRSLGGNKVFPWEKQSVPMLGTPPKVPSERLGGGIGTTGRCHRNNSKVVVE